MSHAGDRRRPARARFRASLCLVALGLLAAPACSSSKEYCEELCACQGGCTDAQIDTCVEDLNDAYSDAASDGCKDEANDYLACLATEPECLGPGVFDVSRCDDEAQAIATCRRITVGSGGNGGAGDAGGLGGTGNVTGVGATGATGATGAGAAGGAGGA